MGIVGLLIDDRDLPGFAAWSDIEFKTKGFADVLGAVERGAGFLATAQDAADGICRKTCRMFDREGICAQHPEAFGDFAGKGVLSMFHESEKIPKKTRLDYR
jgi:hypothetical protein